MSLSPDKRKFLTSAAIGAVESEEITGLPAGLPLAQAILETGWGASIPAGTFNCFGIKSFDSTQPRVLLRAWEIAKTPTANVLAVVTSRKRLADGRWRLDGKDYFRVFKSFNEAFSNHARLILKDNRYQESLEDFRHNEDFSSFIDGIAAVYATDPNYSKKVKSILSRADVKAALAHARSLVQEKAKTA